MLQHITSQENLRKQSRNLWIFLTSAFTALTEASPREVEHGIDAQFHKLPTRGHEKSESMMIQGCSIIQIDSFYEQMQNQINKHK